MAVEPHCEAPVLRQFITVLPEVTTVLSGIAPVGPGVVIVFTNILWNNSNIWNLALFKPLHVYNLNYSINLQKKLKLQNSLYLSDFSLIIVIGDIAVNIHFV